jgi:hypothetical protein
MEITFLTKRSDLVSHYTYFIKYTTDGKKFSETVLASQLAPIILIFIFLFLSSGNKDNRTAVYISIGFFLIAVFLYYGFNKFNPRFYAAKRKLINAEKKLPPRHWQILERKSKLKISKE